MRAQETRENWYEKTSRLYWDAIGWYGIDNRRQGPKRGDIKKLRADLQVLAFDAYEAERRVRHLLQDSGILWEACRRSRTCPRVEADAKRETSPLCAWASMFDVQPLHPNEVGNPREATCRCGIPGTLREKEAL